ncbi:hypothetical protein D3C76_618300 [compost metagenome]
MSNHPDRNSRTLSQQSTPPALLSAPFLEESENDSPIDLEWLGYDDATLAIFAYRSGFALGDSVRVSWPGYVTQGQAIEYGLLKKASRLD